jgi:galactose mutarotase-like enzyme
MTVHDQGVAVAIGRRSIEGIEVLTLGDPDHLEAAFAPSAGMVGCSLVHRGEQVLGLRAGLRAYATERRTFGIPLLHPWANRLGARRFSVAGREVVVDPEEAPVRLDGRGLPIHGLLSGAPGWAVDAHESTADAARLAASFVFGTDPAMLAAFPFPHTLHVEATMAGDALTIVTTVEASAGSPVPISFGWHPYLVLPGVPRDRWHVTAPVREHLVLDERQLPTGAREAVDPFAGVLGERTFDDAYVAPDGGAPFVLEGGGRRIELAFGDGYPFAQVFAPPDDDVIAFEPMTAPTNSLVAGGPGLRVLEPGRSIAAAFSIAVREGAITPTG